MSYIYSITSFYLSAWQHYQASSFHSCFTTEATKYVQVSAASMVTGSLFCWWCETPGVHRTLLCFLLSCIKNCVKSCWRSLSYHSSNLHKLHRLLPREEAEKLTQLGRQLPICNKGLSINTAHSDPQFRFTSLFGLVLNINQGLRSQLWIRKVIWSLSSVDSYYW